MRSVTQPVCTVSKHLWQGAPLPRTVLTMPALRPRSLSRGAARVALWPGRLVQRHAHAIRWLRHGVIAAIAIGLGIQIYQLGPTQVAAGLPSDALFYILFFLRYFAFSIFEMLIYQHIFQRTFWSAWPIFLRKRALNFSFVDYSGEAYFYFWLRRRVTDPGVQVFALVRDVNLLSSLASSAATLLLLAWLAVAGVLERLLDVTPDLRGYVLAAAALGIVLLGGVFLLRRRVLEMGGRLAGGVALWHLLRLLALSLLLIAMWQRALPAVGLDRWIFFLALYFVIFRLPLLPNKDAVFLAAAIAMSGAAEVPQAAMAGLFLSIFALSQAMNFVVLLATSAMGSKAREPGK